MTRRLVVVFLVAVFALVVSRTARADRVEMRSGVDRDVVEIGDTISYTQQIMVHGGTSPSNPKPGSLPGFSVLGGNSGPMHMRSNRNGVIDDVNGLVTSWTLKAERVGTFVLGPSEATVEGKRQTSQGVKVTVVAHGKGSALPRGRPPIDPFGASPFGASPLDPFKGMFDFGDDRHSERVVPNADPKLALPEARAPVAFLHAFLDKTRVVVGEQVTLTVYFYEDPEARQSPPRDVHEATANDFVKRSLLEDETRTVGIGTAMVGDKVWTVSLVRKNALFPLKAGHLTIEPMSLTLSQARVGLRASEALAVDVVDPPLAGRPAGYALGDVGDMSMQATVTPRAIPRDGAVGVTLELRGTGNLPSQLTLPTTPGVEWLEPQTRETFGAMQNDRFGGTRTFAYVVRIHKDGPVDLGDVRLPFFDPEKRAYRIARASIGTVNVAPGEARDAGAEVVDVVLPGIPGPRTQLEHPTTPSYLTERGLYWFALFGSPLACVVALGAHRFVERLQERRKRAAPLPETLARQRRADAEAACRGDDGKNAMGAIARAVVAEVIHRTGVNLRGTDRDTAKRELDDVGIDVAVTDRVLAVLQSCEDARFSPEGVNIDVARATWAEARVIIDGLPHARGNAP